MTVLSTAELLLQAQYYSGSGDWLDRSGNGHDATPQGSPTFAGDRFTLNGSNQYFTITNHADLNFGATDDFTMVAVVTSDGLAGGDCCLAKGDFSSGGFYTLYVNASGVNARDDDGTNFAQDIKSGAVAGVRHAMAMRRDATANELEAFLDGTGSGTPTTDNTGDLTSTAALELGRWILGGTPDNYLQGALYAVGIWRAALTDAEIGQAGSDLVAPPPSSARVVRSPRYGVTRDQQPIQRPPHLVQESRQRIGNPSDG